MHIGLASDQDDFGSPARKALRGVAWLREVPRGMRLPIDKKEIAAQLGITREAFSRALSGMEKFGIRIVGWRSRTPQPPKRGSRWTLSSTASSQSRHFRRGGLDHRADPLLFAFIVFNAR